MRLDQAQEDVLLQLLAEGRTPTEAAAALQISPQTVYTRQRDPAFNARLQDCRASQLAPVAVSATRCVDRAITLLNDIVSGTELADAKTRVAAAKTVIEIALRLREQAFVLPRLAALEFALADAGVGLPMPITGTWPEAPK